MDTKLVEKVDVFISGKELAKLHTFNLTDAFAVIYHHDRTNNHLVKIGTTEVIRNERSPQWVTSFTLDYYFETVQNISVRVYQEEGGKSTATEGDHSLIGEATFRLANLMCASGQRLSLPLFEKTRSVDDQGQVEIRAEAKTNTRDIFNVTFTGHKLANKDGFFGKSDPYLVVSRRNEDNSWSVVWKSSRIDNSLNPKWAPAKLSMSHLCNADIDRPLKIEIFDYDENSANDTMGSVETSVRAMIMSNGAPLPVIEEAKKGKRGYTNSGTLTCTHCNIEEKPSFTDYIIGGLELSMLVAIDFTASNGDIKYSQSLHHLHKDGKLNQYQEAIKSIGGIIEHYDSDQVYPLYGFGACYPKPDGEFSRVSFCFPLSSSGVEVQGVEGILQTYEEMVPKLYFSCPTYFAELIDNAVKLTSEMSCTQENQKYNVLVILTDGRIDDIEKTKKAIIRVSLNLYDIELSVILVLLYVISRLHIIRYQSLLSVLEP